VANGLLSDPSQPTANTANTFTATGLTLNANTSYWLEFLNSTTDGVYVETTSSTASTSSAGWTVASTTDYTFTGGPPYTPVSGNIPLFSINANPVPEPGTALFGFACVVAAALHRRRRAAAV
jgi:MYXO-CTERM domain-containing protein